MTNSCCDERAPARHGRRPAPRIFRAPTCADRTADPARAECRASPIAYNTGPHGRLARERPRQLARMADHPSPRDRLDRFPIRGVRLLAAVLLRFGSGDLRPDGKAHRRGTCLSAFHVWPDLHARRRSVAGRTPVPDRRRLGRRAEVSPPHHQHRDCPAARADVLSRGRPAPLARPCRDVIFYPARAWNLRHVCRGRRREHRNSSLCGLDLVDAQPSELVRAGSGDRFRQPRVHTLRSGRAADDRGGAASALHPARDCSTLANVQDGGGSVACRDLAEAVLIRGRTRHVPAGPLPGIRGVRQCRPGMESDLHRSEHVVRRRVGRLAPRICRICSG